MSANATTPVTNWATAGDNVTPSVNARDVTTILPKNAEAAANLALGKAASQSSTFDYWSAWADAAVDGNTDGAFYNNSVSHTNFETNPWWQVDLGSSYGVGSIIIWNRTDPCCTGRLADYWVFLSDTPFSPTDTVATLQSRAGTWSSHQTTAPNPSRAIAANGTQGRYLRVQLAGTALPLSLAEVQVTLTAPSPPPASSGTNLALNKITTQSSTYDWPTAGSASAVDGSTNGNFFGGSVTHTTFTSNPWWQVDLGSSSTLSSIVIWNRMDPCCVSRLADYWIFVSDAPFAPTDTVATLQSRAGTWSNHQTAAPNPSTSLTAGGAQGRYVRIQLVGSGVALSLAEVQVIGTAGSTTPPPPPSDSNLARGKTASQSSTYDWPTAVANSAIDGNTNGAFFNGSVTHTNFQTEPWWQVDLGASATLSTITVWNRTDSCCISRLANYWVFVSDTPFSSNDTIFTLQFRAGTWNRQLTTAPNPSTVIAATGVRGRYIRIQISGALVALSLAELQVTGTWASNPPPAVSNLSVGRPATQSSTYDWATAGAGSAVDGNTNGGFFNGSVTHTTFESNPWWQVDLGSSTNLSSILVWNRTDVCCVSRLADFWVFVSNTPFSPSDTVATLKSRVGTWSHHQTSAPSPADTISASGVQGRYVRVQLAGAGIALSLAEVQVMGTIP